jgi:hypothetical protein
LFCLISVVLFVLIGWRRRHRYATFSIYRVLAAALSFHARGEKKAGSSSHTSRRTTARSKGFPTNRTPEKKTPSDFASERGENNYYGQATHLPDGSSITVLEDETPPLPYSNQSATELTGSKVLTTDEFLAEKDDPEAEAGAVLDDEEGWRQRWSDPNVQPGPRWKSTLSWIREQTGRLGRWSGSESGSRRESGLTNTL